MFQLLWLPQICYLIAKKIDAQNMLIITGTNFSKCFIWICMHVLCIRNRNALFQIILQVFRSILVTGREVHCVVLSSKEKEVWKTEDGHFVLNHAVLYSNSKRILKMQEVYICWTLYTRYNWICFVSSSLQRDWSAWETAAGSFEVKLHFMKL